MTIIAADLIGCSAAQVIRTSASLKISGITSRGVFLRSEQNKVIFLSCEGFHSPITVNLPAAAIQYLSQIQIQERLSCDQGSVTFCDSNLKLDVTLTGCWQPPPVAPAQGEMQDYIRRMQALCQVCAGHNRAGFSALLCDTPTEGVLQDLPAEAMLGREHINAFQEHILRGKPAAAAACLENLLGMGRGLTPCGDDFCEGLLLLLNRWEHVLKPPLNLAQFNERVISAARRRTTALSATLIECAAEGASDERLLAAADSFFCDTPAVETIARGLLSLGSSSGIDALAGMATALKVYQEAAN